MTPPASKAILAPVFRSNLTAIVAMTGLVALSPIAGHLGGDPSDLHAQQARIETPLPSSWDWLAGTYWYVPASDMPAYVYDTKLQTGGMTQDQTVFQVTESKGGYFRGTAVVEIAGSRSPFTMLGVVTPDGSVILNFLPNDAVGVATTGSGRFTYVKHDLTMLNEMSSSPNDRLKVLHWAYMKQTSPGDAMWDNLPGANVSVPEFLNGR
jgi:hypothetical protein